MGMERQYSCVMVTGASSGLGEEFVKQLAERTSKLVLVARRVERLEQVAANIRSAYPATDVIVLAADLSDAGERLGLVEKVEATGYMPELLINNAGLGDYGEFVTAEWGALESMLKVNIEALTHLSHLIAPGMVQRGRGAILNVSSLASTLPIPDFAVYAATKAYVSSFSEALRIELAESGVDVMHLCPGPVKTEFGDVSRREGASEGMPAHALFYVPKEQVVAEAIEGLDRGRARIFPGLKIAVAGLLIGALPIVALRFVMGFRPRR